MSERIILLGAKGQLGNQLQQSVPASTTLFAFTSKELDIRDALAQKKLFQELAPTTIINAAAYTLVDKAESEKQQAYAVNSEALGTLAESCPSSCRIIHFSTDFVFDGSKSTPWRPGDPTSPLSVYGASKLAGEQKLLALRPDSLIIRTSWLYSAHGKNFMTTMLKLMAEREELGIVNDQFGTPTSVNSLAETLWLFVANRTLQGIYHWSDQGEASWHDFACEIQNQAFELGLLKRKIPLHAIGTEGYPSPAKRPVYSVLDKSDTYKAISFSGIAWQASLKEVLRQLV